LIPDAGVRVESQLLIPLKNPFSELFTLIFDLEHAGVLSVFGGFSAASIVSYLLHIPHPVLDEY
jgi:hypothetical protein